MDPDLNKYDLYHRVTHHPKMSDAEWEEAYRAAWQHFYTPEHMRTMLAPRRGQSAGRPEHDADDAIVVQADDSPSRACTRSKAARSAANSGATAATACSARARSPSIRATPPRPSARLWRYWAVYRECEAILNEVMRGARPLDLQRPSRLRRRSEDEFDALDLYHATSGGEAAVARKRREDALRAKHERAPT